MEEFVIEFILVVFFAPILEIVLTAIGSAIASKWKWHPIKNKFDKTVANATDDTFVVVTSAEMKTLCTIGLSFAIFGYVMGIILPIALYVSKQARLVDMIIAAITFQVVILPMLLIALHYTTKKIYFFKEEIVVKSLIYVKKISFSQIVNASVTETQFTPSITILVITYKNDRKLKIQQNFGNYELAKKRFIDMGLLKQEKPIVGEGA